jgi:hypothetical protein
LGIPRIDDAIGAVDGANREFAVPNPYVPGTLVVLLNGRQLDGDLENGWTELDPAAGTFELKEAPVASQGAADDVGDLVSAYYDNADETAGGGSGGGVPKTSRALDLRPKICDVNDLAPGLDAGVGDGERAPGVDATDVRPTVCRSVDVRPKIASVEEV